MLIVVYHTCIKDTIELSDIGTYSVRESGEEKYFEIIVSADCPNDYLMNFNVRFTYENGMDSATDSYSSDNMGYFNCVDGNGAQVVPVRQLRTELTGSVKRYLAISTDNGYTFHRFYIGITHTTLKANTVGIGYKAVFYGDAMVIAQLNSRQAFGYTLQLEGNNGVTAYLSADKLYSGKVITLRIDNYDAENHGETPICANVILQLADGTVIESNGCTTTMRAVVEKLKSTTLSQAQQLALQELLEKCPIIKTWYEQ